MKTLKRIDRELYKFKPDQMVLRLNEIIDNANNMQTSIVQHSTIVNSNKVLVYGMQPDGTFGIARWELAGDTYSNKEVVL